MLVTRLAIAVAFFILASSSHAQRVLATVYGTTPAGGLGTVTRAAGDVDGDGAGDFVVSAPTNSAAGEVHLVSGATQTRLATFRGDTASGVWGLGSYDVGPIGDVDGDGRPDFAAGYVNRGPLDVFSGATGARLYRMGPAIEYSQFACAAGDVDGDGRGDFVVYANINGRTQLWSVRGVSGTQLATLSANESSTGILRNVGDLNGDGRPEIVAGSGQNLSIYDVFRAQLLRQVMNAVSGTVGQVEVADWDNDGRLDLLLGFAGGTNQPFLTVVSMATGAVITRYTLPIEDTTQPTGRFAVLPDMDGDGHADLVAAGSYDPLATSTAGVMVVMSGATGRRIGAWPGSPQFSVSGRPVASLGDVDGDGVGDYVVGWSGAASGRGGWQVISGKLFAGMLVKPVNCYSGPFPPELGITRPILGQSMLVSGRDAPPGAPCMLAFSLLPPQRTNLGVVGCDTWLDLSTLLVIANPTARPAWQVSLPLPDVQLLVGLEVALQAIYAGTTAPLGIDLTNGVWARLGR